MKDARVTFVLLDPCCDFFPIFSIQVPHSYVGYVGILRLYSVHTIMASI